MSGNFAIKGGGVGRLMANAILNFHFDFPHPSLTQDVSALKEPLVIGIAAKIGVSPAQVATICLNSSPWTGGAEVGLAERLRGHPQV